MTRIIMTTGMAMVRRREVPSRPVEGNSMGTKFEFNVEAKLMQEWRAINSANEGIRDLGFGLRD
jgi:hypothetical protein